MSLNPNEWRVIRGLVSACYSIPVYSVETGLCIYCRTPGHAKDCWFRRLRWHARRAERMEYRSKKAQK